MKRIFIILFLSFLCKQSAYSQLQVLAGSDFPRSWSPDSLVRNILVAEGEEIFNTSYSGNSNPAISCDAIGYFTTGNIQTNMGIYRGLIIATGHVWNAIGPNVSDCRTSRPANCVPYYDPSLSDDERSTYDGSTLEFDFIPKSDTIKFNYVFASEEYPEFAGGGFNDRFGFFISGPNPLGGVYNNKNIALIPGTDSIISINTLNENSYSEYYVNNNGGSTIEYDAFTVILTAKAVVIPCQTYHLKMSICDFGDDQYDSAVFIEAESFSSNSIYTNFVNPTDNNSPLEIYEGCYGVDIEFKRPDINSPAQIIPITIAGTATMGSDYQDINNNIIFGEGDTAYTITITPIMDGINEGEETVMIIYQPNQCDTDTIIVNIHDTEEMDAHISYTPPIETDTAVVLTAVVENGYIENISEYRFLWNTGDTSNSIVVPTVPADSYWFEVMDRCKTAYSDTVFIGIMRDFAFESLDTAICMGNTAILEVEGADYSVWSTGDTADFIFVSPDTSQYYTVSSYKYWNNTWWNDNDTVLVIVKTNPTARIKAKPEIVTTSNPITELIDVSIDGNTREWSINGDYQYDRSFEYSIPYTDSTLVTLISYNDIMCSDTTTKMIYMVTDEVWIPNSFTPMSETNNTFEVKARNLYSYSIHIYNRWGELLYESDDISKPWDGKYKGNLCTKGVYVYIIRFATINYSNTVNIRKGTVFLNY